MSEPQLFSQETIDEVVAKLQAGQVVSALTQVLANETISRLADVKKTQAILQQQINIAQQRIVQLQDEYNTIIAGQPSE